MADPRKTFSPQPFGNWPFAPFFYQQFLQNQNVGANLPWNPNFLTPFQTNFYGRQFPTGLIGAPSFSQQPQQNFQHLLTTGQHQQPYQPELKRKRRNDDNYDREIPALMPPPLTPNYNNENIVRVANLPLIVNENMLRTFFNLDSFQTVVFDGGSTGVAFVFFGLSEDASLAVQRDGERIGDKIVKINLSSMAEMNSGAEGATMGMSFVVQRSPEAPVAVSNKERRMVELTSALKDMTKAINKLTKKVDEWTKEGRNVRLYKFYINKIDVAHNFNN